MTNYITMKLTINTRDDYEVTYKIQEPIINKLYAERFIIKSKLALEDSFRVAGITEKESIK